MGSMAPKTCVVTGGAGFIGCALSSGLGQRFERVIVLDSLHPQIHRSAVRPAALDALVEFRRADVTESSTWDALLAAVRPNVIVHLAAETGTGQSLTESSRHAHVNVVGTTTMLDALSRHKHAPDQLVLASSRAVYGEGAWRRTDESVFYPGLRGREQLERGAWDFPDAKPLRSQAGTTEPRPTSVYGVTKLAQEQILEAWTGAYGTRLGILRLQNVYGPGQSLINSYTGIVSLFVRLAKEGKSIPLYEDGMMRRDFVYIDDVASALLCAIDARPAGTVRFDIGTGDVGTIRDIATIISSRYGAPTPHVSAAYRHGDVRHAMCDISLSLAHLRWSPQVNLQSGLNLLCDWIDSQLS
jgi:dTDP-L-rhamnose 4-epimerase